MDDSVVTEPAARISRGHAPIKGLQDDDMKGSAGASQEEPAEPDFTLCASPPRFSLPARSA